jgi:hypothetical protein
LSWRWRRCAGVGEEGPDNRLEGREEGEGGRGEGDAQHDERHVKGAVAFWGDVAVVPMEITFMDNGGKHNSYYVNSSIIRIHIYEVIPTNS